MQFLNHVKGVSSSLSKKAETTVEKFRKNRELDRALAKGREVQVGSYRVKVVGCIAEGGFSSVYRVKDVNTGGNFALKHVLVGENPSMLEQVRDEAMHMEHLSGHPNIVKLYAKGISRIGADTEAFLLMELCEHSLVDVMAAMKGGHFTQEQLLSIFLAVCQAVSYMHNLTPSLTHRDLKPENILRSRDGIWKLCDFGSATTRAQVYSTPEEMGAEEDMIRKYTTPAYRAPEMWDLFQHEMINNKVDIWALGCVLYRMAYLKNPFDGDSMLPIMHLNYEKRPASDKYTEEVSRLIEDILRVDPSERPDIELLSGMVSTMLQGAKNVQVPFGCFPYVGGMGNPFATPPQPPIQATGQLRTGELAPISLKEVRAELAGTSRSGEVPSYPPAAPAASPVAPGAGAPGHPRDGHVSPSSARSDDSAGVGAAGLPFGTEQPPPGWRATSGVPRIAIGEQPARNSSGSFPPASPDAWHNSSGSFPTSPNHDLGGSEPSRVSEGGWAAAGFGASNKVGPGEKLAFGDFGGANAGSSDPASAASSPPQVFPSSASSPTGNLHFLQQQSPSGLYRTPRKGGSEDIFDPGLAPRARPRSASPLLSPAGAASKPRPGASASASAAGAGAFGGNAATLIMAEVEALKRQMQALQVDNTQLRHRNRALEDRLAAADRAAAAHAEEARDLRARALRGGSAGGGVGMGGSTMGARDGGWQANFEVRPPPMAPGLGGQFDGLAGVGVGVGGAGAPPPMMTPGLSFDGLAGVGVGGGAPPPPMMASGLSGGAGGNAFSPDPPFPR